MISLLLSALSVEVVGEVVQVNHWLGSGGAVQTFDRKLDAAFLYFGQQVAIGAYVREVVFTNYC